MATDVAEMPPRGADIGAVVVSLLALAPFINYADRRNLATAAPLIKDQLRLATTQIGVPAQLLSGWLVERMPPARFGAANGLIGVGMALGPALGTYLVSVLMAKIGWRDVFVPFGVAFLLWLIPWYGSTRREISAGPGVHHSPQSIVGHESRAFLRQLRFLFRHFLAAALPRQGARAVHQDHGGGQWRRLRGLRDQFVCDGRLSDRWIRSGVAANRVRKTFITPRLYSIGQTMAGLKVAAKWMGVQNCVGNLAGIVAPIITGLVVDSTGQYDWAFVIAACVAGSGIFDWAPVR
jgi:MFS family permease